MQCLTAQPRVYIMVTFELESPMRAWRAGDYPVSPWVCVTARDESGPLLQSSHLMTDIEINHFFGRVTFELKLPPKHAQRACDEALQELAHQQARMLGHAKRLPDENSL